MEKKIYPTLTELSLATYRFYMTRNIVAGKYWLIEFFTVNVKLQIGTINYFRC